MLGVGISNHVKILCPGVLRCLGTMLYKRTAKPLPPAHRVDKEWVQFGISIRALKDRGEPCDLARLLCGEYAAIDNLLER